MLEIDTDVVKGIMFIHLEGELNDSTIRQFDNELNYLLYKQGMHYFVFDFKDLDRFDVNIMPWLENKLVEIFLSCGKVVLCGLDRMYEKRLAMQGRLFCVRNGTEVFRYLNV